MRRRLAERWLVDFDDTQSIGRRYRRQDEIGTPFCVTVDFESLEDDAVTIRERDTTEQVRVPIDALVSELSDRLGLWTHCAHGSPVPADLAGALLRRDRPQAVEEAGQVGVVAQRRPR